MRTRFVDANLFIRYLNNNDIKKSAISPLLKGENASKLRSRNVV